MKENAYRKLMMKNSSQTVQQNHCNIRHDNDE